MVSKFFDTSSLLNISDYIAIENFLIADVTIHELESIKTSTTKDFDIKSKARKVVRYLWENQDKYEICVSNKEYCAKMGFDVTNDNLILCAAMCENSLSTIEFYTDDLILSLMANSYGLITKHSRDILQNKGENEYVGYKEVVLTESETNYFYTHLDENKFECVCNEYLIIKNIDGVTVDRLKWNGSEFVSLSKASFKSSLLGTVKPLDDIQACAFDSIVNNDINLIFGRAGTGKSTIPFSYIIKGLESQKIKKCYIIYHFETLRGAKTLGFLPGDLDEKMLGTSSIGNILSSKTGDIAYVKKLISDGKIEIVPTSNIRGVEYESGSVVWVTECQNLSPYIIKTIIQRCADGCKQIFEGDIRQSDVELPVSGMSRVIDVFKGYSRFGCLKLKNNYRSEIGALADKI